jgi:hypothetical protein
MNWKRYFNRIRLLNNIIMEGLKVNEKLSIEDVARELTKGLTEFEDIENFEEVITGLEFIMVDERLTIKELREQCWEDSDKIFQKIYG